MDEIVQDERCRNFEQQMQASGPCWRFVIVPGIVDNISGFWFVFVFHHALTDGLGGFVFRKGLLRSLNCGDIDLKNPISPIVEVQTPKHPPPAMEDMYKLPLGLTYILEAVPPHLWTCHDLGNPSYVPPPSSGLRTELLTLRIPAEVLSGVLMKTKEKRIRATPLIEVILSLALLEVFPHSDNIRVSVIVSMRRWLTEQLESYGGADNVLGSYLTEFPEDFTRAAFDFSKPLPNVYSEAQRARETIDKVLLSCGKNTSVGLLRYVANFDSYSKSKTGQRREDSVEVSNVGVFKTGAIANMDNWNIGDVRFSQSANVTGPAVECSIVSLESGTMALGFTWQEGIVTNEEMRRVLERTKALLELVGTAEIK
ncbi:alcohol acetyltransferase [Tirmania nivea]|nr:alcohol acetyltransferase [Tirmania nivea]